MIEGEFLVVGGGIAGLSLAVALARRNAKTVCIEANFPGYGCTTSSLGLVYPVSPLTAPIEVCEFSVEAWHYFAEEVQKTEFEVGKKAKLQSRALIEVTTAVAAEATYEAYRRIGYIPDGGYSSDVLAALAMLRNATPATIIHKYVLQLEARSYLELLLIAFKELGGEWICPCDAESLDLQAGVCVGAITSRGVIRAEQTILCTGAHNSLYLADSIQPVRGQSFLAQCPERVPSFLYTEKLDIVERMDGSLHVGSTVEADIGEIASTMDQVASLRAELADTLKFSSPIRITESLAGIRAKAFDEKPIVGATHIAGLHVLNALYRNGVFFSPLLSELLAKNLTAGEALANWLSPRRFVNGRL